MAKKIVIALGGNALGSTLHEQADAVQITARAIVDLIAEGHEVIVAHGNGPQVGIITGLSCAEGEVDNSVFDRYIVPLYKQASYKPYVIAAMIFMAQVKDPVKALMELDEGKDTRKIF